MSIILERISTELRSRAMEAHKALIPEFFAGRSVFITGASGFLGKVLVERLLSTCPDVGELFLLLRSRRGADPDARLVQIKDSHVFSVLRREAPERLSKVHAVPGDIAKPHLGLDEDALAQIAEVSVVFNCAASVKFDEPVRHAVEMNTLSVVRVMEVADRLRNLAAFVQVSTAFSNEERRHIEERVYPPARPLHSLIEAALASPVDTPREEVARLIAPKHNTYTFSKALGELVLQEHGCAAYPVAIVRPSIVTASLRHPFPGWVEGRSGAAGTTYAVGAGFMHVQQATAGVHIDTIPVDLVCDAVIAVAWEIAVDRPPAVQVYNCTAGRNRATCEQFRRAAVRHGSSKLAYCFFVQNRLLYHIASFCCQTLPLYLVEYTLRLFDGGKKKRLELTKVASTLLAVNDTLRYFSTHEWTFSVRRLEALRGRLSAADAALYNSDPHSVQWEPYLRNFVRGNSDSPVYGDDPPKDQTWLQNMNLVRGLALLTLLILARYLIGSDSSLPLGLKSLGTAMSDTVDRTVVSLTHAAASLASLLKLKSPV